MSAALASKCYEEFAIMMCQVHGEEYLQIPDENDIINITQLHHELHGVWGMLGSLNCMHTLWKYCPNAWQQSYELGKESGGPTIVLRPLGDHHLQFWHAAFGYAGSLND
jgi:Plant transposon protein